MIPVFVAAFAIRLVYFLQFRDSPVAGFFAVDTEAYHAFAVELLKGNFFHPDTVFLSPLYPFFVAGIYGILGAVPVAVAGCQAVLDALTCVILYKAALLAFERRSAALCAALAYAFYATAIFYTGFLLDATLTVFLNAVLILVLLTMRTYPTRIGFVWAAGCLLGVLFLLRAHTAFLVPFVLFWIAGITKPTLRGVAACCAGIALLVIPFSFRNYLIEKRFSPFPVQSGINFYIGNNPHATGRYVTLEHISDQAVQQVKDSFSLAQTRSVGSRLTECLSSDFSLQRAHRFKKYWQRIRQRVEEVKTPSDASRYWFMQGVRFVVKHKAQAVRLALKKTLLYWNAEEVSLNVNYYFCRRFLPLLRLPLVSFGLIAPLALIGMAHSIRCRNEGVRLLALIVCGYLCSLVFYFVSARYRMTALPALTLLFSYGLVESVRLARNLRWSSRLMLITLLGALLYLVHVPIDATNSRTNFAASYNNLGIVYGKEGKLDDAVTQFRLALAHDPRYVSAHFNLANAYAQKDLHAEALAEYEAVVSLDSAHARAHNNLAVYYLLIYNEPGRAMEHYQTALANGLEANPAFLFELMNALQTSAPSVQPEK